MKKLLLICTAFIGVLSASDKQWEECVVDTHGQPKVGPANNCVNEIHNINSKLGDIIRFLNNDQQTNENIIPSSHMPSRETPTHLSDDLERTLLLIDYIGWLLGAF